MRCSEKCINYPHFLFLNRKVSFFPAGHTVKTTKDGQVKYLIKNRLKIVLDFKQ
jgi:hypothetical protein